MARYHVRFGRSRPPLVPIDIKIAIVVGVVIVVILRSLGFGA